MLDFLSGAAQIDQRTVRRSLRAIVELMRHDATAFAIGPPIQKAVRSVSETDFSSPARLAA